MINKSIITLLTVLLLAGCNSKNEKLSVELSRQMSGLYPDSKIEKIEISSSCYHVPLKTGASYCVANLYFGNRFFTWNVPSALYGVEILKEGEQWVVYTPDELPSRMTYEKAKNEILSIVKEVNKISQDEADKMARNSAGW